MRKLVVAVVAVLCVAGCAADAEPMTREPVDTAPAPVGAERGSIVSQVEMGHTDLAVRLLGATATRVLYRSTSRSGEAGTEVSGVVFTPDGVAPEGGWPIVSVGHGTTGVTDECAPSLYPNLLGAIGMVAPLLERGMVVTATDYEGIGTPGEHPYLDPDAAAYDIVDAVRAARNVVPEAGTRWGAIGTSQGGHAVWAAAERADYGDGLEFLGSAALSPALDLTAMFGVGHANTLPQALLTPFMVDGLQFRDPDVAESDYLTGTLETDKRALTACTDLLGVQKAEAAARLGPNDASPVTEEARARMADWLSSVALPRTPTPVPILVVAGQRDQLVEPKWTQDAVGRACSLSDTVELRLEPNQGHADQSAVGDGVAWLADRFAGVPAVSTCEGR